MIKCAHASVQVCGGPFLTFAVTVVNVRNVFYYKLSVNMLSSLYISGVGSLQ